MSVSDDIGMAELLAILAAVGIGGYLIYKYLGSATCIAKVGAIPGVTGATTAQAQSTAVTASKLKPGGSVIWSCGSDYDYAQPCGQIITEVRHNPWDYVPILNNWGSGPLTYTCVPVACYSPASTPCLASQTGMGG
jgi:hypothetical protein